LSVSSAIRLSDIVPGYKPANKIRS